MLVFVVWNMIIILLFLCIFQVFGFSHLECKQHGHDSKVCEYMKEFDKEYKHHDDFLSRYEQLKKVKHMGDGFGFTSRSDILDKNFNSAFKNINFKKQTKGRRLKRMLASPKEFDLRNKHVVSTPSDQGACGNCFAYSAAAAIEYYYAKLKNLKQDPDKFSVWEFTQCTSLHSDPNSGCEGGLMEYIYEYAEKYATPLKKEYDDNGCNAKVPSHVKVESYEVQGRESNPNIERHIPGLLVNYGPITVGIDSNNVHIDNYVSGTFNEKLCGKNIDHAVTIVGYTKHDYIIKNSWGTDWGENGYFRLKRGVNACGIAEYVSYITSASLEEKMKKTGPFISATSSEP